jgi:hypothetical protein
VAGAVVGDVASVVGDVTGSGVDVGVLFVDVVPRPDVPRSGDEQVTRAPATTPTTATKAHGVGRRLRRGWGVVGIDPGVEAAA